MLSLIYIDLYDNFHKIIKLLTGYNHSIIGICKDDNCYLFNMHNGMRSPFFDYPTSKDLLFNTSSKKLSYKITCTYIDCKMRNSDLDNLINNNFNVNLEINNAHRYNEIFESYFKNKKIDSSYVNGLSIVNIFFSNLKGFKTNFSNLQNLYLDNVPNFKNQVTYSHNLCDVPSEIVKTELSILSSSFIDFISTNNYLKLILDKTEFKRTNINEKKLTAIKENLENLINVNKISPICNISELIYSFNDLANEYDMNIHLNTDILKRVEFDHKSVKYIDTYIDNTNKLDIPYYCLSSNSNAKDLKKLEVDELKLVLIHIDSLRSNDGSEPIHYRNIKNKIVNEIAIRKSKSKYIDLLCSKQ